MNFIPERRRQSVCDAYGNANLDIKYLLKEYGSRCKVNSSLIKYDEYGRKTAQNSYYSHKDKTIFMNELKDNDEYSITFRHEFGHFIDDMLNDASLSENFDFALEADKQWVNLSSDMGIRNYQNMLNELKNSSVIDNRYVSDILSGMFLNDSHLRNIYDIEGCPFYGHPNDYWLTHSKALNIEVFANLIGIYSENDSEAIDFINKWFPNTNKRFLKIIGDRYDK